MMKPFLISFIVWYDFYQIRSNEFECTSCGKIKLLLQERTGDNQDIQNEAREVSAQMAVTGKVKNKWQCYAFLHYVNLFQNVDSSSEVVSSNNATESSSDKSKDDENAPDIMTSNLTETAPSTNVLEEPTTNIPVAPSSGNLSSMTYNIIISSAVLMLIALVLRRLVMMDASINNDDLVM